jgi:hypothetical protein
MGTDDQSTSMAVVIAAWLVARRRTPNGYPDERSFPSQQQELR